MARGTRSGQPGSQFEQVDNSAYMLGLPSSRPRLGKWGVVAVLAGTLLAIGVVMFESYVVSLF
jgi:hypothetical protein